MARTSSRAGPSPWHRQDKGEATRDEEKGASATTAVAAAAAAALRADPFVSVGVDDGEEKGASATTTVAAAAAAALRADPFVGVGVGDGGVETDRRRLAEGLGGGKRK
ncbi:unnamed protein product, partial [Ectocarpus sp. 13 AM-2016]